MTDAQLFLELQDILQTEVSLEGQTSLQDLDEWDSLAMMACMAYFDKNFGVKTSLSRLRSCATVAELAALANSKEQ